MSILLSELALQLGLPVKGNANTLVNGVCTIDKASKGLICSLTNKSYQHYLKQLDEAVVVISAQDYEQLGGENSHLTFLISTNPKLSFAKIINFFHPLPQYPATVHPTAIVDPTAQIDPSAHIGPYVVIGARCQIGPKVVISAHCTLLDDVTIGSDTLCYPNVTLCKEVKIGKSCIIHSGAVIGSDGFGVANHQGRWVKIQQIGSVVIHDHVEIGANTTIDRGAIENTVVGEGTVLDNQIQIAHNVIIGQHCAIAGCVAIAGSTKIGNYCQIGGGSIINGHITLTDHVHLAGNSQVANNIKEPGAYASAIPAREISKWKRNIVRFHKLDEFSARFKKLEQLIHQVVDKPKEY